MANIIDIIVRVRNDASSQLDTLARKIDTLRGRTGALADETDSLGASTEKSNRSMRSLVSTYGNATKRLSDLEAQIIDLDKALGSRTAGKSREDQTRELERVLARVRSSAKAAKEELTFFDKASNRGRGSIAESAREEAAYWQTRLDRLSAANDRILSSIESETNARRLQTNESLALIDRESQQREIAFRDEMSAVTRLYDEKLTLAKRLERELEAGRARLTDSGDIQGTGVFANQTSQREADVIREFNAIREAHERDYTTFLQKEAGHRMELEEGFTDFLDVQMRRRDALTANYVNRKNNLIAQARAEMASFELESARLGAESELSVAGIRARAPRQDNLFNEALAARFRRSINSIITDQERLRESFKSTGQDTKSIDMWIDRLKAMQNAKLDLPTMKVLAGRFKELVPVVNDAEEGIKRFNINLDNQDRVMSRINASSFSKRLQDMRNTFTRLRMEVSDRGWGKLGELGKKFNVTADDIENSQKRMHKSLLDSTQVDDTVAIGFARIARFLAVVIGILPVATVLVGVFSGAVVGLAGGVVELVGGLSSLVGLLGVLPGLITAASAAFASLALTFGPVAKTLSTRVTEVLNQREQARKNTTRNAEEVRNAQENLSDTTQRNREQEQDAVERVTETRLRGVRQERDAMDELHKTRRTNSEQEADAERSLHRLRRTNREQERDIERDIAQEKLRVLEAVKAAEDKLKDLQKRNAILQQELDRESANARASFAGLQAEGASPEQLARAEQHIIATSLNQKLFAVSKEKNEEKKAAEEVAKAKKSGDGRLLELQERRRRLIRDNAEQEADAERSLARLKRDNEEQEQSAAKKLAQLRIDNVNELRDAEQNLARVRATNVKQIRDAEERLVAARRRAAGEVGDPFENLTATETRIVKSLLNIKDAWDKLTASTRERGERLFERALSFLSENLPHLAAQANRFSDVFLDFGEKLFDRVITDPATMRTFNGLLDDGVQIMRRWSDVAFDASKNILRIADSARPLTRFVSERFAEVGDSINRALERAATPDTTGESSMDRFFRDTGLVVDDLVSALENLGAALIDVLQIAKPFGEVLIDDFRKWTEGVRDFTESMEGQNSIRTFFEDADPVFRSLINLAEEAAKAFFGVGRALIRPAEGGGKNLVVETIDGLAESMPKLQKFIVEATQKNGPALMNFLRQFGKIIGDLVGAGGVFSLFLGVLGEVMGLFNSIPDPLRRFILTFFTLGRVITRVAASFGGLKLALAGLLGKGGFGLLLARLGGPWTLFVTALISLPGVLDKVMAAFNGLSAVLEKFFGIIGLNSDTSSSLGSLTTGILALTAFSKPARTAVLGLFGALGKLLTLRKAAAGGSLLSSLADLSGVRKAKDFFTKGRTVTRGTEMGVEVTETLPSRLTKVRDALRGAATAARSTGTAIGRTVSRLLAFARLTTLVSGLSRAFVVLKGAFIAFRAVTVAFFATNPLGWIVLAAAAIVILVLRFKKLREAIINFVKGGVDWIKKNWKTALILALTAPLTLLPFLFYKAAQKWGGAVVDGLVNALRAAVNFIKDNWKRILIGALVAPFAALPALFLAFGGKLAKQLVNGIWDGLKGAAGWLGDKVGGVLSKVLGGIDIPGFSKPDHAAAEAMGIPMAQGVGDGFSREMLNQQPKMEAAVSNSMVALQRKVETDGAALERTARTVGDNLSRALGDAFVDPLRAQLGQETPAAKELRLMEERRTKQQREDERKQAEGEVTKSSSRVTRLREQLARAEARKVSLKQTTLSSQFQFGMTPTQTNAARRANLDKISNLKAEIATEEGNLKQAQKSRKEVLDRIAYDEKVERLRRLDIEQQAAIAKRVKQAEDEVNAMVSAWIGAVDKARRTGKRKDIENAKDKLFGMLTKLPKGVQFQLLQQLAPVLEQLNTMEATIDRIAAKREAYAKKNPFGVPLWASDLQVDLGTVNTAVILSNGRDFKDYFGGDSSIFSRAKKDRGGTIPGYPGQGVPILAHAGEWVLNHNQQARMAAAVGTTPELLQKALFTQTRVPRFAYAVGGRVSTDAVPIAGRPPVMQSVTINTASPTVDVEYVARVMEQRMRSLI
jgi:hypothetical protein